MFRQLLALIFLPIVIVADAEPQTPAERKANAADWARQIREDAFDAVMPGANRETVAMPICRVTTLRVSGSLDTFEYAVRLVEPCPTVSPKGGDIVQGTPTGDLVIAEGSPLTDQLGRLRLQAPDISPEMAISRLRIRRIQLKAGDVRKLLASLSTAAVSPLPPTAIVFDEPTYEIASTTGIAKRVVQLSSASKRRSERQILSLVRSVAAATGFSDNQLRYDASFWD